jgi:MoaA/NifB/PqqE/SkfB family radical SAM enzyme
MCWWWGESGVKPTSEELSTSEIKGLISKVKKFNPFIAIGGGEPLVRKDILEVLKYAKEQGLSCEVVTNGTLITPELAKQLVKLADSVIFSIDGPPEINDHIRGMGTFDRVARGIRLVQEAKEISQKETLVRINCTISSLNLQYVDELVDIAHSLNCGLSLNHLIFSDSETAQRQTDFLKDNLSLEDETIQGFVSDLHKLDVVLLIDKLHRSKEKANRLKVPFYIAPFLKGDREIQMWYSNLNPIAGMHCTFPWTNLYIRPDGEVLPCEFIDYALGNILKEDIPAIWNGAKARQFRRILKKGLFPGCLRCCKLTPGPLL